MLFSSSETTVVATRCEFAQNNRWGVEVIGSLTSATFKNCVFHDNQYEDIYVMQSTIHLHGEATAIHSNKGYGIWASSSKVLLHLPSHHNTIYNNGKEDRHTSQSIMSNEGGTITNIE